MHGLRTLQFMIKGYRNFTKNDKKLPALEGNLEGKNVIVTGANSGIGYEAAKFAALKNANVYLVCRSKERGEAALKQLLEETKSEKVHLILGEMGEKEELTRIFEEIKERMPRVDFFVHNAGCMLHKL